MTSLQKKHRLGLVGCGHLNTLVAQAWLDGLLPDYELVGATSRSMRSTLQLAARAGCQPCATLGELLELHPDYVVEAASPTAVREIALPVLQGGADLVVLSIGAFADQAFLAQVEQAARKQERRVHLATGAIGGFDLLRTMQLMGGVQARFSTEKGPQSLEGTPVYSPDLQTDTEPRQVFCGSAQEAIATLPTRVNVAVAASLATAGPEATQVTIRSVPGMAGDDHRIEAQVEGVRAVLDIYSKTSDIAGWSVVALLRNLVAPIVF